MSEVIIIAKRRKSVQGMALYWLTWCLNRGRITYRRWCSSTAQIRPSTQPISKLHRTDGMRCQSVFPFGMHLLDSKKLVVRVNLFHRNRNPSNVFDIGRGRPDFPGNLFNSLLGASHIEEYASFTHTANRNFWAALQFQMPVHGKCSTVASGCRSFAN